MTIDQKLELIIAQNETILRFVTPKIMGGPLVTDGQPKPEPPKKEETSMYPGQYYGTVHDPMKGYAPVTDVIDLFSEKRYDPELGRDVSISGFVGGTLYDWARRDLKAFLAWYKFTNGYPLNLTNLHPEQKSRMGLPQSA